MTQVNNMLEFGKASMYVIVKDGLQKEPLIHHNKPTIDSKPSRKNVAVSRTRAIDFSGKEIANASKSGNKLRVLDLNGSVRVDFDTKRNVQFDTRIQRLAGVKGPKEYLNQPTLCLNAPGVNDLKQTAKENERMPCLASSLCCLSVNRLEKSTSKTPDEEAERKSRRCNEDTQEYLTHPENFYFKNKKLSYDHRTEWRSCENGASAISTKLVCGTLPHSGNCNLIPNIASEKQNKRSGKYYLKSIFYSKGKNYAKSGKKAECLPQIRKTTGNQFGRTGCSITQTKKQKFSDYERKQDKLLLPLNISVSDDNESKKHQSKSIVKLPTVVDKKTGRLHLALEAIAFEQSDYNKWSRRQKRITPGNPNAASTFPFPLMNKVVR